MCYRGGGGGLASRSVSNTRGGSRFSCRDLTEISRRVLKCGEARMPIQRLNSEIKEEKAGRIKEGGMSHIWRALNVSSLDRLSHGRVAEGHLLDFPCFWLEFPIDKSPLSPSRSHRSLGRIKGRL